MDTSFEQKVRERAYEIWVAAGMTDGMATDHWLSAQHALIAETAAKPAKAVAKSVKTTQSAKSAKTTKTTKPRASSAKSPRGEAQQPSHNI